MADKRIDRITIEVTREQETTTSFPGPEFATDLATVFNHLAFQLSTEAGQLDPLQECRIAWGGGLVGRVTYHELEKSAAPEEEYTWADAREMATACNARSQHIMLDRLDVRFADGSHRIYDNPETAVDDMADMLADIDGSVDF